MWRDSPLRRVIAIGLLLSFSAQVTGCSSWSAQTKPPGQVLTEKSYKQVRVTKADGSRIELYNPTVVNDTLTGYRKPPSERARGEPVPIAVSDILYIEVRRIDTGKTILLAAGISVTLLLIAAASTDLGDFGGGSSGDGGGMTFSCPLVYSWDGKAWRLDSGTYGGAIMPALQRTDLDNLAYARPEHGRVRLKLANELRETDYVDALSILAVDHPRDVSVMPDATGKPVLHAIRAIASPVAARNDIGEDVLPRVRASDSNSWESVLRQRDPGSPGDRRDGIQLEFAKPKSPASARLVLEARNTPWASYLMGVLVRAWGRDVRRWYDPATSASLARQVAPPLAEDGFLTVLVRVNGAWERRGLVWEVGPEAAKRVALPLDLTGVTGDRVEVRLESTPNFWMVDYVALGEGAAEPQVREIPLERALRGDGQDMAPLLAAEDRSYWVMEQGDSADISVPVPPVPAGLARSYILKTAGWYRIHGAELAAADTALLSAIAAPHGTAAVAVRFANDALTALR